MANENPYAVYQPFLSQASTNLANMIKQKRAEAAAAEREQNWQNAINTFKADKTPQNMMSLYQVAPERFQQFTEGFQQMQELERTQVVQNNAELMGMIQAGDVQGASEKASTIARAYRNAGENGDAEFWDKYANQLAQGNGDQVYDQLMMINSATPEGQAANESVYGMREDRRQQFMTEADIAKIMSEVEITNPEDMSKFGAALEGESFEYGEQLKDMLLMTGGLKDFDDMTPNQQAQLLTTLRKEWTSDTEPFRAAQVTKDKMDAALAQGTSQGDVSSIFLFMKMLDENSVVRESEFRTASGMGGLLDQMKNLADSWVDGQRLQPGQRENMAKITDEFYKIMAEKQNPYDERMNRTADLYGIPHNLIQFTEEDMTPKTGPRSAEGRASTPATTSTSIPGMDLSQLKQTILDGNSSWMTEEDKAALKDMSEEEIKERYPKGYEWIAQQNNSANWVNSAEEF